MFCTSCGKQIEDGSLFCEHCGAKQEAAAEAPRQQTATVGTTPIAATAPAAPAEKKPMDKKTKIILIAAAAAAVVLFAIKGILGSALAPDKTVGKFVDSIRAQNANDFRKVTTVYMNEFELTDERLTPFFERYSSDLEALASLRNVLMQDLSDLQSGGITTGNGVFRLVKKQSNFLFTSYAVEITPITVSTYCEFDGAEISLMGETYSLDSDGGTLRILPGVYSGTASYTSPETGVTLEKDIEGYLLDSYNDYLSVYFEYTSMWLESYNSNLELKDIKIDGKSYTGELPADRFYNGFYIYPVDPASTVVVTASAHGIDFEQTFVLSESTNCRFNNYQLPEALAKEVSAIGADVIRKWADVSLSYSDAAVAAIASAYSETSPDYIRDVTAYLDRQKSYANNYTICRRFQAEPTAGEVRTSIDITSSGVNVTVRQELSGMLQMFYYASGEPYEAPYDSSVDFSVQMRYVDGAWRIISSSIY